MSILAMLKLKKDSYLIICAEKFRIKRSKIEKQMKMTGHNKTLDLWIVEPFRHPLYTIVCIKRIYSGLNITITNIGAKIVNIFLPDLKKNSCSGLRTNIRNMHIEQCPFLQVYLSTFVKIL